MPNFTDVANEFLLASGLLQKRVRDSFARGNTPWRILRYERITNAHLHTFPLRVDAVVFLETFALHMEHLRRNSNVVSLSRLVEAILAGEQIEPETVAITFDPGYVDNYGHAFTILRELKLPATFFLAPRFIGSDDIPWYEQLIALSLGLSAKNIDIFQLPEVRAAIGPGILPVPALGAAGSYSDPLENCSKVISHLQVATPEKINSFENTLLSLEHQYGPVPRERYFMNWNEVTEIYRSGCEIGITGWANQLFPTLTQPQLTKSIEHAFEALAERSISPLPYVALPQNTYSLDNLKSLFSLGITAALGGNEGIKATATRRASSSVIRRLPIIQKLCSTRGSFIRYLWAQQ